MEIPATQNDENSPEQVEYLHDLHDAILDACNVTRLQRCGINLREMSFHKAFWRF